MNGEFTLSELARETGIEPRTIRSYIAEGLLRGPNTVGRNASYSRHHYDRLCAIRVLRDQDGLGLSEIRQRFLTLSEEAISSIATRMRDSNVVPEGEIDPAGALDYVRALRRKLKAERDIVLTDAEADNRILENMALSTDIMSVRNQPVGKSLSRWRLKQPGSPGAESKAIPASLSANEDSQRLSLDERLSEMASAFESTLARQHQAQTEQQKDQFERQIQELHQALRQLNAQNTETRERERDMREMLAVTQTELEKLRRTYEAAQASILQPSDLAKDPDAPTAHALVRISVLPDVEIFVRGASDPEKLKLVREHAENLKKALQEDRDNER
jgi:DNA-binding transcriptional MerR regulator